MCVWRGGGALSIFALSGLPGPKSPRWRRRHLRLRLEEEVDGAEVPAPGREVQRREPARAAALVHVDVDLGC